MCIKIFAVFVLREKLKISANTFFSVWINDVLLYLKVCTYHADIISRLFTYKKLRSNQAAAKRTESCQLALPQYEPFRIIVDFYNPTYAHAKGEDLFRISVETHSSLVLCLAFFHQWKPMPWKTVAISRGFALFLDPRLRDWMEDVQPVSQNSSIYPIIFWFIYKSIIQFGGLWNWPFVLWHYIKEK